MKWTVEMKSVRYGQVEVVADTKEEAEKKALDKYSYNEVNWSKDDVDILDID